MPLSDFVSPEGAIGVAGALSAAAFGLSKFMSSWKGDQAHGAGSNAMKVTLDSLSKEIERLSKANAVISKQALQYQQDLIDVNNKLIRLRKRYGHLFDDDDEDAHHTGHVPLDSGPASKPSKDDENTDDTPRE